MKNINFRCTILLLVIAVVFVTIKNHGFCADARNEVLQFYTKMRKERPHFSKLKILDAALWRIIGQMYEDFEGHNITYVPEMLQWAEQKVKIKNDNILNLYYGILLFRSGKTEKSIDVLKRIGKLEEPMNDSLNMHLFMCYYRSGLYRDAERYIKKIKFIANDPEIIRCKGLVYGKNGKKKKAVKVWKLLLERYPWYSTASLDIIISLLEMGNYSEALRYAENSLEQTNLNMIEKGGYINDRQNLEKKLKFYKGYAEIMCGNIDSCIDVFKVGIENNLIDMSIFNKLLDKIEAIELNANNINVLNNFYTFMLEKFPGNKRISRKLYELQQRKEYTGSMDGGGVK